MSKKCSAASQLTVLLILGSCVVWLATGGAEKFQRRQHWRSTGHRPRRPRSRHPHGEDCCQFHYAQFPGALHPSCGADGACRQKWQVRANVAAVYTACQVLFCTITGIVNQEILMQKMCSHVYVEASYTTSAVMSSCRSVSLVGEKERKMLKDIVKKATNPVKSRIIPHG